MEALERRRSSKAALLQDQLQALAETRYIRANGAFTHPGARSDPVSGIQGIELPGKELLEEPDQDGAALSHMLAHPSSDGAVNGEADLPSSAPQMPSYEVNNGVISSTGAQENFRHWRSTACASVPMLLETTLGRALVSHSLAVSRACVGLFVDHLSLLRHLKFLRRAFFLEAGDWGDAFLAPLAERVDGLQPLTGQVLHVALQDAIRVRKKTHLQLTRNYCFPFLAAPVRKKIIRARELGTLSVRSENALSCCFCRHHRLKVTTSPPRFKLTFFQEPQPLPPSFLP